MADLFDNRLCVLGEGPLWHPERGQLFWFDVPSRWLLSRDSGGPREWRFDEMCSAAGWIDHDTLLIASETGLFRFHLPSGDRETLVPLEADNPGTRSNDGRADPMGGFWIGTMGKHAERGAGSIYRFHRGRIERLHGGITIPNSICFAADGRRAYFTDSLTLRIMTQSLDAEGWPDGDQEVFVDHAGQGFFPDGAVTDSEGALWSAQWGAARVARYLPDGSFDRAVTVPGRHASCPALGGPDFSTLFVTTARQGIEAPDADQGRTYSARVDIPGRPEPRVIL